MENFFNGWFTSLINGILLAIPICLLIMPMIYLLVWSEKK